MKKKLIAIAALTLLLAGCSPSPEELHQREVREISRQAALAEQCRESGGRYVLTTPPGYASASYWCIWDEEREGGEW